MRHQLLLLVPALALSIVFSLPLHSAVPSAQPAPTAPARPTLVVMLVVDQLRADYVQKYGHQWSAGLRRLMDQGAWFQNAAYPYFYTVTCAGHATISTGAFPRTHGIIGNSWWERSSGATVECADDPGAQAISYGAPVKGGKSASRLVTSTFTDNLRAQSPVAPRIVTFSMKERTAIMLAGHRATAVTWYDTATGSLVTSSAYATAPAPFIERFVRENPIDRDLRAGWTRKQPAGSYLFDDGAEGERPPSFWTSTFPHPFQREGMKPSQRFEAWEESPFSDAYLERLAEAAIDSLPLGKGPGTDYLGISFSALDAVGHDFGPQSHEVQDVLIRLDETLGRLFSVLDRRVGPSRYVVALSGDHGVGPIPEQMAAQGIPAGRIAATAINSRITETLQIGTGTAVARTLGGQVYLTNEARDAIRRDAAMRDSVVSGLERLPGVARAFITAERDRWDDSDPLARAVRHGYFPDRSGDIVLVQRPYWQFGNGSATTHGTPYRYDTWVPVFLYGSGIKAGRYTQAITPADIAPTLAWLCGVTLPHTDGHPLVESVVAPSRVRAAGTDRPPTH